MRPRSSDRSSATLRTDYIDVLTFYYVEKEAEWRSLIAPGGACEYCRAAKQDGIIRSLGITSHQRPLAAEIARGGLVDALMIRYNAAHRGAEREIFPVTDAIGMPVIAYTALRWGALLQPTPDDPPGLPRPDGARLVPLRAAIAVGRGRAGRAREPGRARRGPRPFWRPTGRSHPRNIPGWPSMASESAATPAGSPDRIGGDHRVEGLYGMPPGRSAGIPRNRARELKRKLRQRPLIPR